MEQPAPPPILSNSIPLKRRRRNIVWAAVLLWSLVIFGIPIFIICKFVSTAILHISNKSSDDRFSVQVLEVKLQPTYFEERLRVQCPNDMDAGIWVTDLKKAGFSEERGINGETYYREGDPRGIGGKKSVHSEGTYSTCEILVRIKTLPDKTEWHSEIGHMTLDTSLSSSLDVSAVETNWSGSYPRDSDIPLANLGNYKIMLSVK